MASAPKDSDFALMEHVAARQKLGAAISGSARIMSFCVLAPVYPALGCGTLRVLRVRPLARAGDSEEPEVIEVIAGYESYERLEF